MPYYRVLIITTYDSMEWSDYALIDANNAQEAQAKAAQYNWTHGDTIEQGEEIGETQKIRSARELPEGHYQILKDYFVTLE